MHGTNWVAKCGSRVPDAFWQSTAEYMLTDIEKYVAFVVRDGVAQSATWAADPLGKLARSFLLPVSVVSIHT